LRCAMGDVSTSAAIDAQFANLKHAAIMDVTIDGPKETAGAPKRKAAIKAREDAMKAKQHEERERIAAIRQRNKAKLEQLESGDARLQLWAGRATRVQHGLHVARELLDSEGIKVNKVGIADNSALHRAVASCNHEMADVLISKGADLNARNMFGLAPLHVACKRSDIVSVRALLAAGAELDPRDGEGFTPLLRCAHYGDAFLVQVLLDEGADPAMCVEPPAGEDGLVECTELGLHTTAMDLARQGGNVTVCTLLSHGAAVKAEAFG